MKRLFWIVLLALCWSAALLLAGCQSPTPDDETFTIRLRVDGETRDIKASPNATVSDALREAGVTLGDRDRVNPPTFSRLAPETTITIVRVTEDTTAIQEPIPYERRTTLNDDLPAGQQKLLQAGTNGIAEITFRVTYEDDVEVSRNEIRRVVVVSPQPEVIMIGSQGDLPPVPISGTFAYVSGGNAWIARANSANRRALTVDGGLDERVFQLSRDGKRLLFTRSAAPPAASVTPGAILATPLPIPTSSGGSINTLWVVIDTGDPQSKPIQLKLANILYADFLPGDSSTILYSTAEPRPNFPGWQANNDLWRARLNSRGVLSDHRLLLPPSSGGIYGWQGTYFSLSPDGSTLAWAQADAVGILTPGEKETPAPGQLPAKLERLALVNVTPRNALDFVWVPSVAWSPDGKLLATTTHGEPVGSESPEDSPVFNLTLMPAQGGYSVDIATQTGLWAAPQFAPADLSASKPIDMKLVYLRAIQPFDSVRSRYQLVLADRDGSNSRVLYPPEDQPGIGPQIVAWSPDGQQIALVAQGNLILLDIATGITQQLTQDGSSSSPVWRP